MEGEKKELDFKKIEKEAFLAIDELFSEGPSETDPRILRLEEAILSLDWEFTERDLGSLQKTIEELKTAYEDKLNKILIGMMESVTKFLVISKELAPSDTLAILGKIAKTFREINTTTLSEREKRQKIKKTYTFFIQLRDKILGIKKEKVIPKKAPEAPSPVTAPEKVVSIEIPEAKLEAPSILTAPEELTASIETGFSMLKELIQSLNDTLKNTQEQTINQIQHLDARIPDFLKEIEKINARLELIEAFKPEFSLLKQKITGLENILIQKETAPEIEFEPKPEPKVSEEISETREAELEPELKPEIPEEVSETREAAALEIWPYVSVFSLGEKLIALPLENVANTYPVSSKKAKNLPQKGSILLKKIKSFWHKLRKNMRGELKNLKEKDLENLKVPVLKLSLDEAENAIYKTAVLLQHNEKYGILFLNKIDSKKLYLPERGNKIGEKEIEAEIEIPGVGIAYLINPGFLLEQE